MRHLLAISAAIGLVVACSTFSSDGGSGDGNADAGGAADGAPTESGADGDALAVDGAAGDAGTTDGGPDGDASGDPRCTALDSDPATIADWAGDVGLGGSLTSVSHDGRMAMAARVESSNARARIVHDFKPGPGGAVTVIVDLAILASPGGGGSLVELVTISCGTPSQKVQLEIDPAGLLHVEAVPSMGSDAAFGAPPATWTTLTLTATLTAVTVQLGGSTKSVLMPTSFAGGVGCTVAVGAVGSGNIGLTQAFYSRACIE